ncbi:MAG: hypothetical protein ACKVT2_07090 [Saprospiraceae bacterium]
MIYKYSYSGRDMNQFPGGGLGCLIFSVLLIVGGYYILQGLYYLLLWAAPALLVLALIINWRVFPDTIKSWLKTLETNPLSALISLALAVLVFPFFSLYILLKAIGYRKMEQLRRQFGEPEYQRKEEVYAEFEELESTPKRGPNEETDHLELPKESEKQQRKKDQNPYDSLFD